jgi:hypothetical protein
VTLVGAAITLAKREGAAMWMADLSDYRHVRRPAGLHSFVAALAAFGRNRSLWSRLRTGSRLRKERIPTCLVPKPQ